MKIFIKRIFAGTANILFVIQIFYPQIAKAGEKPLKSNIEVSGPAIADTLIKVPEDLSQASKTNPVKALADRVRGHVNSQPLRFPNQHWVRGAYYAGLMAMYESTSDRAYLDDCMKWGRQVSWQIKEQGGGPYESGAYPLDLRPDLVWLLSGKKG